MQSPSHHLAVPVVSALPGHPAAGSNVGRLAATIERLRQEVERAQRAAEGRALIEVAKGILIERLQCGLTAAEHQLAALADQAGVSRLELAADIINQATHDKISQAAHDFLNAARSAHGAPEAAGVAVRLRTAENSMLKATDVPAVAQSLLEHALTPLDATAVAIWMAGSDTSLTLAGHAGFSEVEARQWRYVPPGVATPARRALDEQRAVWIRALSDVGLPSIGMRAAPDGGRVVVPAGTGGRILGVLEIGWARPLEPQPPQVTKQIEALAELCAHTLDLPAGSDHGTALDELTGLADCLPDAALILRPHLDHDGKLIDFRISHTNPHFVDPAGRPVGAVNGALLLEAYPLAAEDSGLFSKIERVHATGEPYRADQMTITALVDQVPLDSVATVSITRHGDSVLLVWRVQDETVRLANLLQHAQRLGRIGGFEENALTGDIIWNSQLYALYGMDPGQPPIPLERLSEHAHPDDANAIGRFLRSLLHHRRPASIAFRLQRPDGIARHIRIIAEPVLSPDRRLLAIRGAYQDISAQHWTEVALAATRDQLAHTEEQAAERNRLALQLQQAIMPPSRGPLEAFDLNIAVRYRPAEQEHLVGGDWYDAVVLPSKQVLLSLGDVAGHGIEAATGMVVLRNALRGLAATGAGPGQLLTWLNMVTHHLTENVTATAVCALYDPETRILRWARAGHLPPILIRQDDAAELDLIGGLLLGALSDAEYEEAQIQLEPGDILLMYTDGLIERRDLALHQSQEQLLRTASHRGGTLEHRLDHLLTHSNSDTDDDTCLIGVQLC
ncbi:transcription antitermination regulator [Planobispora rosea]|uniref:Transcription antitermination regulator n=1 Tax=Planobispora rosea TaxID=35762 RepID=A0A8J3S7S2_PLARO|nr:SpoIIE family protein phosphatase [Planobispora rosea]GGT01813.1 transcription antitermination regulator [Planobispora rosea]GIH88394.1 transcription antitermination regulator [Planobispora rosea]